MKQKKELEKHTKNMTLNENFINTYQFNLMTNNEKKKKYNEEKSKKQLYEQLYEFLDKFNSMTNNEKEKIYKEDLSELQFNSMTNKEKKKRYINNYKSKLQLPEKVNENFIAMYQNEAGINRNISEYSYPPSNTSEVKSFFKKNDKNFKVSFSSNTKKSKNNNRNNNYVPVNLSNNEVHKNNHYVYLNSSRTKKKKKEKKTYEEKRQKIKIKELEKGRTTTGTQKRNRIRRNFDVEEILEKDEIPVIVYRKPEKDGKRDELINSKFFPISKNKNFSDLREYVFTRIGHSYERIRQKMIGINLEIVDITEKGNILVTPKDEDTMSDIYEKYKSEGDKVLHAVYTVSL